MNFEWSKNEIIANNITITANNITLNKAACNHFEEVGYVLLGIDDSSRSIGIKPVTKEDINQEIYPRECLYKISIGKSYGRITSKSFIQDLVQRFNLDFNSQASYKYSANYDVIHKTLIVKL
ncbi:MAG: hypothetical protein PHH04_05420 [Thomasclavelia sp.]|nr:hypothetical protein [Thomasclavelia sp.]